MEVGPFATFYFENYDTMWLQVMEMLRIERGGAEQLEGELEAYNPLIGQGRELIATIMLEIEDQRARDRSLLTLGGIEDIRQVAAEAELAAVDPGAPGEFRAQFIFDHPRRHAELVKKRRSDPIGLLEESGEEMFIIDLGMAGL